MSAPFDRLDDLLPAAVRRIVARPSAIPTVAARARQVAAEHPDFVRGDIGQVCGVDPDAEILYGPPVGSDDLRAAVAELWSRTFRLDDHLGRALTKANVTISTGAAEALTLAFKCFASDDRVVALPRGHWENYANGVDLAGGRTVEIDWFDADGRLDTAGLKATLDRENVAVLVANFPCNPTGAVLTDDEAAQLAAVARETDVIIVADEVYSRLRFDGHPPVTLLRHAPERTIVVSSASKEYLVPGARIGFCLCADERFTDQVLRKLMRANTASPNVLGQDVVLRRLEIELADLRAGREPRPLAALRDALEHRRDALVQVLSRHGMTPTGRAGHVPSGTIFLVATLPSWWAGDDESFATHAIEAGAFSTIPGSSFGLARTVRFSFGSMSLDDIARLDGQIEKLR